jgi:tRNA threonylcarbamoyl adenosine modification protein YeaZ
LALVIDTSSAAVTAGVVACSAAGGDTTPDGVRTQVVEVLGQRVCVDARAHGELLAPSVRAALEQAGAAPADLAAVVAGLGPGPFTGLRVGLMTAAAFADALQIPSYGVCSLDAIAAALGTDVAAGRDLLVAADARRKEIYWARYRDGIRVDGPAVARPQELPDDVPADAVMAGAGARLYAEVLGREQIDLEWPSVLGLATLAVERVLGRAPSEVLVPLYLRRPDALASAGAKKVSQPRAADR